LEGQRTVRWWRRNDGFEWKEYVRTTVLVRRQHRRDKIEAAKDAAIDGVKEAGRKGLAVGAAGAEAAGQAAVKIAKSAADGAAVGAEKGLALAGRGASAARSRIALASEPVNTRLSRPGLSMTLAAVALLAGAGAAVRLAKFGWDIDTALLFGAALVTGVLWLWPRVFSNSAEAEDDWAIRTERVVAVVDRAGSWLPMAAAALVGLGLLMFAGPVISRWIDSAAPVRSEVPAEAKSVPLGTTIAGTARVAGPGLLRVQGMSIQLDGLTMLDAEQTCRRDDGTSWTCGAAAKQAFEKLARQRGVRCSISGEADGIRSGSCQSEGGDLGAALVRGGHGFADGLIWASYSTEEQAAREAKAGLWAGVGERPEDWRARVYSEAAAAAPGQCPIKGRIQRSGQTYLMPHQAGYARAAVREEKGERWFCSEDDAVAAGFMPLGK
jgi:endonuclease YncB( thermonuclease family)